MAEKSQFAYTGKAPEKGLVGYVNIQETEEGVRISVRSEGPGISASYTIPLGEARNLFSKFLESGDSEDA